MTRLLFWIALVILVVMAVRSKVRAAMAARGHGPVPGPGGMGAGFGAGQGAGAGNTWRRVEDASEPMSCCAYCGVYFPASEAVRAHGHDYCSPAHAQQPVIRKPDA